MVIVVLVICENVQDPDLRNMLRFLLFVDLTDFLVSDLSVRGVIKSIFCLRVAVSR